MDSLGAAVLEAAAALEQPFSLDALRMKLFCADGAPPFDGQIARILYDDGYEAGMERRPNSEVAVRVFYKQAATLIPVMTDGLVLAEPVSDAQRLHAAATALYDAGHWRCDRPVDEVALWTELRDALGRVPGAAPQPMSSINNETTPMTEPNNPSEMTEVERVALQAIIDVRHRAAASFDEGFTGTRGQAYVLGCHDAVRAAIEALQTKPELPSEIELRALFEQQPWSTHANDVERVFAENLDEQANRLGLPKSVTESLTHWQDRVRKAALNPKEGSR